MHPEIFALLMMCHDLLTDVFSMTQFLVQNDGKLVKNITVQGLGYGSRVLTDSSFKDIKFLWLTISSAPQDCEFIIKVTGLIPGERVARLLFPFYWNK